MAQPRRHSLYPFVPLKSVTVQARGNRNIFKKADVPNTIVDILVTSSWNLLEGSWNTVDVKPYQNELRKHISIFKITDDEEVSTFVLNFDNTPFGHDVGSIRLPLESGPLFNYFGRFGIMVRYMSSEPEGIENFNTNPSYDSLILADLHRKVIMGRNISHEYVVLAAEEKIKSWLESTENVSPHEEHKVNDLPIIPNQVNLYLKPAITSQNFREKYGINTKINKIKEKVVNNNGMSLIQACILSNSTFSDKILEDD